MKLIVDGRLLNTVKDYGVYVSYTDSYKLCESTKCMRCRPNEYPRCISTIGNCRKYCICNEEFGTIVTGCQSIRWDIY